MERQRSGGGGGGCKRKLGNVNVGTVGEKEAKVDIQPRGELTQKQNKFSLEIPVVSIEGR